MKECFLVIGSNSFSGANFIDHALRGNPQAAVIGISRSPEYKDCFLPYKSIAGQRLEFYQLDLNRDLEKILALVKEFRPDYIVNFAAQGMVGQSWSNPGEWFQTNCIALMELVKRLSEGCGIKRFVQVSSPEIYGACNGVSEEEASFRPSTPYAASKACGDLSIYPYFFTKGFPLVYTRASNVYGPYQQLYRIIPRTIISIRKGIKIPLHGGGKAVKSYIHIKDVCDATLKIARSGNNGEAYHISPDGSGISIRDLVKKTCALMGADINKSVDIIDERPGQDAVYVINSDKVRRELGWQPRIGLDEGLRETIGWVERYWNDLKGLSLEYAHKP